MSMKKWQKLASEKAEVEQQNDKILAVIKNNKINKEFGQLSGEDLFKPITSRLEKLQVGDSNSKEEEEIPDYGMDEFDLNNPFDGDFNPDAEHHYQHQHHHQHHHQQHHHHHRLHQHRCHLWLKRKKRN